MGFRFPRHPEAFSLDKTSKRLGRKDKQPTHLAFLRLLPCVVCLSCHEVEAAHIRMASPDHGKPSTAMGQKPPDRYALPLCSGCHRTNPDSQHTSGEASWWSDHGIDAVGLAMALYCVSGDEDASMSIIAATQALRGKKGQH